MSQIMLLNCPCSTNSIYKAHGNKNRIENFRAQFKKMHIETIMRAEST